jgi:hypothetical protein
MSAKAFGFMLLIVVVLGGVVGGALFAFSGDDVEESAIADVEATATPTGDTGAILGEDIFSGGTPTPDDALPDFGGRLGGGLPIEPIAGTLASISPIDLVVVSADTGAETTVIVPPQTPVRLSETAGDTTSLVSGAEIVAFLQRTADGTITVTTITMGAFGGGGGGRIGAGGGFGGGTTGDGTEFNAVPGTVTSFAGGTLALETADGPVEVTVSDDTPISVTVAFADLDGQLALDSTVTVIGQRDEAGVYTPITIATGDLGGLGAGRGGFGGGRRGQRGDGDGGSGGLQLPE